ncbi:phage head closure protein [Bacillus sp. FJAT-49705]|uniref:Phage head closure protein n=1 Tax=Cytobacillus citreus TaxID=2833586 RepID=A0ABS5NLF0_9BACI|nr:phage head closure protein [Cytobacillus citreus]
MNPALFKHRITFQRDKGTKDADGFPIPEKDRYEDVKTVWAMIKTLKGREFHQAASIQSVQDERFIIRYTTGIDSSMRIKFGSRFFEIIAPPINDDELNKTLTIVGREIK